jgi:hypothetical protein
MKMFTQVARITRVLMKFFIPIVHYSYHMMKPRSYKIEKFKIL